MDIEKVLIADTREETPREVDAERINGATVRHDGKIYSHASEHEGRWVYLPAGA